MVNTKAPFEGCKHDFDIFVHFSIQMLPIKTNKSNNQIYILYVIFVPFLIFGPGIWLDFLKLARAFAWTFLAMGFCLNFFFALGFCLFLFLALDFCLYFLLALDFSLDIFLPWTSAWLFLPWILAWTIFWPRTFARFFFSLGFSLGFFWPWAFAWIFEIGQAFSLRIFFWPWTFAWTC